MKSIRDSRLVKVAAAASVLAVFGAACGQTSHPADVGVRPAAHVSDAAVGVSTVPLVAPDDAGAAGAPHVDASAEPPTAPAPAGDVAAVSSPAEHALRAAVDPACAGAGERVTVQVSGIPRASLAMAVAFADDQAHGLMAFSDADDAGSFAWTVVVPPDAPAGEASVLVGARDPADGRDVGTTALFLVSAGGCR